MATTQNYSWPSSSDVIITGVGNPTGQPVPPDAVYVAGENPSGNLEGLQTDNSGNLLVSLAAQPSTPLIVKDQADGTPGAAAPALAIQVGGSDGTDLRVLSTDASGHLNVIAAQSTASNLLAQVSQPTASALNATVVQGTASNLLSEVSQPTASLLNATVVQGTAANLLAQVSQPTAASLNATVVQSTGANLHVNVDNFPATQPVSGTVTANQGTSPWVDNLTQVGGSAIALGQTTMSASLPVAIASDQSAITVAQATAANLNATVVQGTAANLNATVVQSTYSNLKTNAFAGTPTALTITQAAITVGTSAVRLTVSGSAPSATRVALVADPDSASTAKFYIGSSSVTNSGATRGIQIVAGQSFIANNDAGDYWIVSDTAGQTVYVMEQA